MTSGRDDRKERLAQALRDNLRRRKVQSRASEPRASEPDSPQPDQGDRAD